MNDPAGAEVPGILLGVGNIVGVSAAIWWGGAGAVFWMWLSALLAASLKYAETVLGVKNRLHKDGRLHGGAPVYIRKAFAERRLPRVGAALGKIFALLCLADALSIKPKFRGWLHAGATPLALIAGIVLVSLASRLTRSLELRVTEVGSL